MYLKFSLKKGKTPSYEDNFLTEAEFYLKEHNWDYNLALNDYKIDLSFEILNKKDACLFQKQKVSKFKKFMRKMTHSKNSTKKDVKVDE